MKSLKALLLFVFVGTQPLWAQQSVTFSSLTGPNFVDSTGADLTVGSLVRIGFIDFDSAAFANASQNLDLAMLDSLFTPLAEGIAGHGIVVQAGNSTDTLIINDAFGGAGEIFGQITGITESGLSLIDPLVAFVINSDSLSTATELGLFSSSAASWHLPGTIGATTLTTESIDIIEIGNIVQGPSPNFSLISIGGSFPPIPEPSSSLMVLSAIIGLLGRRSR